MIRAQTFGGSIKYLSKTQFPESLSNNIKFLSEMNDIRNEISVHSYNIDSRNLLQDMDIDGTDFDPEVIKKYIGSEHLSQFKIDRKPEDIDLLRDLAFLVFCSTQKFLAKTGPWNYEGANAKKDKTALG
jgi:hypothetical protein